jgi:hypothetical protein
MAVSMGNISMTVASIGQTAHVILIVLMLLPDKEGTQINGAGELMLLEWIGGEQNTFVVSKSILRS